MFTQESRKRTVGSQHKRSQHKSARLLQKFWRRSHGFNKTHELVKEFLKTGPTAEKANGISFQELVLFLREQPTIRISKACLQRIHLLCTLRHGPLPQGLAPASVNVRVFLAGYMIAFRPTHVFESMGTLELALLEAATSLLATFEQICESLKTHKAFSKVPKEMTEPFQTLLLAYLRAFKAWKVPDEAKLICRIKHALKALYLALALLPHDEPEDSALKVEFHTQMERLRAKLLQIGGPEALARIEEELSNGGGGDGGGGDGGGGDGGGGGGVGALPGRMTRKQLAHELLLDPTFQLDHSGGSGMENPVFQRVRESFHTAFWNSLVDDLRLATPCYARVLRVLAEVRDGITGLAGSAAEAHMRDAVDLEFIKQQAEAGLYEWASCCSLVASMVQAIELAQAPRRHDETRAKWAAVEEALRAAEAEEQPSSFCKALEFLLERLNTMRMDAANARLRLIAPVIQDHGVDYERTEFERDLNDGSQSLEKTKLWIHTSTEIEVRTQAVNLDELLNGTASAFVSVHTAGMLHLLAGEVPLKAETVPETLSLDVERLVRLQRELKALTTAASMLVTAAHELNSAPLVARIAEEVLAREGLDATLEAIAGVLGPDRDDVVRRLADAALPTNVVHRLLATRVKAAVSELMQTGRVATGLQVAAPLFPRFEALAARLMSLAQLNRTVHLQTYNLLIGEAALSLSS